MRSVIIACFLLACFKSHAVLNPVYDSIPMRDGKKLAMTLYKPAGCVQCPTILIQTPYNRLLYNFGLPLNIGFDIDASNYNIVVMDWRGFYGSSAAAYTGAPERGKDGYDAVEWIAAQTWSDGKVGTWGPSALGRVQYLTARENPPHLTCIVPVVASPYYTYQEYYPGGVFRTEYCDQLDALGFPTSPLVLTYPTYNFTWSFIENANNYPDSILVPAFLIGGWYDHNTQDMLDFFTAIRGTSTSVQNEHRMLMGPWVHGGHSTATVGSATQGELSYPNAVNWTDSLALAFFDYHMRAIPNGWNTSAFVQYYQMGENLWETNGVWPPAGLNNINLYMHDDGSLTSAMPIVTTASQSFLYDPLDPSPTVGGSTLRNDLDQGPYDQDSIESRSDVLVFSSVVLGQNVIMKGKAQVHLKISSDKKDTDFAVRLTDVYPDGRSMLLVDGIARMRFRDGFTAADTSVMVPGNIYDCVIDLPSTSITFLAGHRIRVDVTSANYPKYNRNDNSGGAMYPGLNGDSLANPQTASNTVYLNGTNASYITLPLVDFVGSLAETKVPAYAISLHPNPANATTNLLIELHEAEIVSITLFDATGKKISNSSQSLNAGKNIYPIPLSLLEKGIYTVSVAGKNHNTALKLVVQ